MPSIDRWVLDKAIHIPADASGKLSIDYLQGYAIGRPEPTAQPAFTPAEPVLELSLASALPAGAPQLLTVLARASIA